MSVQFSVAVRNARLDAIETQIGVSAVLKIRTGAAPVTCATADSGTVLATMSLPVDWSRRAFSARWPPVQPWPSPLKGSNGFVSRRLSTHAKGSVSDC